MPNDKRLIEVAFPLKETSLDSVHEKNVRHGHISTLHIWPARRPLAACRAALIATLLPDPGDPAKRKEILERMAGTVVKKTVRKKIGGRTIEIEKEETEGGILHWGRENGPDLQWFRDEIRKAYGGRAPRVLDPFAGGGAIPLEAMRLGCEATAIDINPVAWFILKCTLEYPQKLAGQTRPLPDFILQDAEYMESFLKAKGFKGVGLRTELQRLGHARIGGAQLEGFPLEDPTLQADLAWHVRAWGRWVLAQARKELAPYYPTYADFEPLKPGQPYEPRPIQLVPLDDDGNPRIHELNADFSKDYLADSHRPRWVAKPTVAYLWARTVKCKQCRAIVPLLKTRWLCKKDNKRVLLTMEPNAERTGVVFGIQTDVPLVGGNAAQRREHDKRIGAGTKSRTGAYCPCCSKAEAPTVMTMEDIRLEGKAGRIGAVITATVLDGPHGKEYRLPSSNELACAEVSDVRVGKIFESIPYGIPFDPIIEDSKRNTWCVQYGLSTWNVLFNLRQLLSIGTFIASVQEITVSAPIYNYSPEWTEAIQALLACAIDRQADANSTIAHWQNGGEFIVNTFQRFALPVAWDFCESRPISDTTGGFSGSIDWVCRVTDHGLISCLGAEIPSIVNGSAINISVSDIDVIITDPPYYDSIGYSVLMDFFYVWLRRSLDIPVLGASEAFSSPLGPKWDSEKGDGELVDDASRFGNDRSASKINYEGGMRRSFEQCNLALGPIGRLVVVFANKQPDAWETLVGALIQSGFVVDGSWPIQTERQARTRSLSSAALASSVWLVCRKRDGNARPGWDTQVLEEMRENIAVKLREFWDAGIRGPDFVWSATGPALEAYSKHPVVKKADDPGQVLSVSEFLRAVRRIVVDFVVGRVLTREQEEGDMVAAESLDDVTTYYLLHRHDFGMEEAPIGACILYALSCNLSDSALVDQWDLLVRKGSAAAITDEEDDELADGGEDGTDVDADEGGGGGAKVRLKAWNQRKGRSLGLDAPSGRFVPQIDQAHRLMHLWRAGDVVKVDDYLESSGLKRNTLFAQLLQAIVELAPGGSEERSVLESLSNHIVARGGVRAPRQLDHMEGAGS